jgi:hypothetical protein
MADISLSLEGVAPLNYLLMHRGEALVPNVTIENLGWRGLDGAQVRLDLEPKGLLDVKPLTLKELPANGTLEGADFTVVPNIEGFLNLAETAQGAWTATLERNNEILASVSQGVEIHTLREWVWRKGEGLAASAAGLVTPNDPPVIKFVQATNRTFDGYQSGNPDRVRNQMIVLYDALKAARFNYINPPPSFELTGQKIRLPREVLEQRQGTCLDWAIFLCAIVEYVGLAPVMVLIPGHAFNAVWLRDPGSSYSIMDSEEFVELVEMDQMLPLNSTSHFEAGDTFEKAVEIGKRYISERGVEMAIDITGCRNEGIKPIALGR